MKLALQAIGLTLLFVAILLGLTVLVSTAYLYRQAQLFASTAQTPQSDLISQAQSGWHEPVTATAGHKNILVLGVDTLAGRGNVPPLTDTMVLVSINLQTGSLVTLPIPRDLWSDAYQTKINALYAYGQDRYPDQPARFPTEAVSELTQVPIHHTLVISLDQLSQLIDTLGGVDVTVETGFVDTTFPRPDVDVTTERDPAKLYMTVEFKPGVEKMTGERALQFIRSRHSGDDQGDDAARSRRQQQVMAALLTTLTKPRTISNPVIMGQLYSWYATHFASQLSITQGIATARALLPVRKQITFIGEQLGIYPDNETGLLIHPQPSPQYLNQWVYIIREPATFSQDVMSKLRIQ